jgi:hypothetical protein
MDLINDHEILNFLWHLEFTGSTLKSKIIVSSPLFFVVVVLGYELRDLCLLGRLSTIWVMLQASFILSYKYEYSCQKILQLFKLTMKTLDITWKCAREYILFQKSSE